MDNLKNWLAESQANQNKLFSAAISHAVVSINSRITGLSELTAQQHRGIREELAAIKSEQRELKSLVDKHESELAAIRSDRQRSLNANMIDDCEILILGIPPDCSLSNFDVVCSVLKKISFDQPQSLILSTRDWTATLNQTQDVAASISTLVSVNKPLHFKSVVFKRLSPTVRDAIMLSSSKLKLYTANSPFNIGGDLKIFLCALWPKQVFNLLKLAHNVAREKNLSKPFVRNLTVFLRRDKNSSPVAILNDLDLEPFKSVAKS